MTEWYDHSASYGEGFVFYEIESRMRRSVDELKSQIISKLKW